MGVRDQGSGVSWRAGCSLEVEKLKKVDFCFFGLFSLDYCEPWMQIGRQRARGRRRIETALGG